MNDVLTGHSPDVEVFTDGLLQVVVHWTFLESHVEISPQVFIQHLTCWQKKMTKNLKGFVFFMVCKTAPLTMTEVTNWKFICGDACVCVWVVLPLCVFNWWPVKLYLRIIYIQLMACEVILENYLYNTILYNDSFVMHVCTSMFIFCHCSTVVTPLSLGSIDFNTRHFQQQGYFLFMV